MAPVTCRTARMSTANISPEHQIRILRFDLKRFKSLSNHLTEDNLKLKKELRKTQRDHKKLTQLLSQQNQESVQDSPATIYLSDDTQESQPLPTSDPAQNPNQTRSP